MKNLLLICCLTLLTLGSLMAQSCLSGGISFTTQSGIDDFSINFPNCTEIEGDVEILGLGNITNLNGLSQITSILGSIEISTETGLVDLTGLEGVQFIGGNLTIANNANLISLSGLENLVTIEGELYVLGNPALTTIATLSALSGKLERLEVEANEALLSLTGLEGITLIDGPVNVEYNPSLINMIGFDNIDTIQGSMVITNSPLLTSLSGLESLRYVGNMNLIDNINLASLSVLSDLTTIKGMLQITNCNVLTDLSGLELIGEIGFILLTDNENLQNLNGLNNIATIGDELVISGNPNLQTLSGLDNLTYVDHEVLFADNALTNFTGLEALESLGHHLLINEPALESFTGLESLTRIGDVFQVLGGQCENFTGLDALTYIGDDFRVANNSSFLNFEGLNSVDTIGGRFRVESVTELQSILQLESLNYIGEDVLFSDNTSLSECQIPAICFHLWSGGVLTLSNNAEGCNDPVELSESCLADYDYLIGNVYGDLEQDCTLSGDELNLNNLLINASNDDHSFTVSTDSLGNYVLPLLEGAWHINAIIPSLFWTACFNDTLIVSGGLGDTLSLDFVLSAAEVDCPYVAWDFIMPSLRNCSTPTFSLDFCNYGSQVAEDVVFSVELDDFLNFTTADYPYTIDTDGAIIFEIDELEILECLQINLTAFVDCNNLELFDLQCVNVELDPYNLCVPDPLWDQSNVVVNGFCQNDSIHFELQNTGVGNMTQPTQFKVEIVIDDVVLLQDVDDYQLDAGGIEMLSYELQGTGMRLETNQAMGHPIPEEISVVVPSCDDIMNNAILNLLPSNNGDPFSGKYCGVIIGSYDPNIKTANPAGIGDNHEIDKDWELDYTIQFQNTGNAEAYIVVIRDTLSDKLDLSTLSIRGASHDFTWALNPDREIAFTFDDINLPDSTTNEPESHGFVSFSISPKQSLLPGDIIENSAGIYFDFNDPIITDTIFHTIRKPVVASSEHLDWCSGDSYENQLVLSDTSFQYLTEFVEYDSVHFVHLDVVEAPHSTASAEVLIGEYFEGVLILSDTTFLVAYSTSEVCDSLVTYTIAGLSSMDEVEAFRSTSIFPNPVDGFLMVSNHQNGEAQRWTLVNHLGVHFWERNLSANETLPKIDMSEFPVGVYLLSAKSESGAAVWKVVKGR